MKIRLVMLGKTRRAEIRALLDDYLSRIRHYAEVEVAEVLLRLRLSTEGRLSTHRDPSVSCLGRRYVGLTMGLPETGYTHR